MLAYGLLGWTAIGLLVVLAAAMLGPVARWTSRTLVREHPEMVSGDRVVRVGETGQAA